MREQKGKKKVLAKDKESVRVVLDFTAGDRDEKEKKKNGEADERLERQHSIPSQERPTESHRCGVLHVCGMRL